MKEYLVTDHINKYCWGIVLSVYFVGEDKVVAATGDVEFQKGRENSFISGISVKEGYRTQGLGTDLLKELERISRRNGRYIVELETEADDEYAQKFYEKRGYVKVPELTYSTDYGTYFTFRKVMEKVEGEI